MLNNVFQKNNDIKVLIRKTRKATPLIYQNKYFQKTLQKKTFLAQKAFNLRALILIYREQLFLIIDKVGLVKAVLLIMTFFWISIFVGIISFYNNRKTNVQDDAEYSKEYLPNSYENQNERSFHIRNIIIPVYIKSTNSYRKIEIDLITVASHRDTKEYLDDNYYLVNDALHSNFEPVVSNFPLTNEGKNIISEKVKLELNKLIKYLALPGEIQYVYIDYIFAGQGDS